MLTCETVNRVFYRQRRFCTEHQSHLTHPSVQRLMFWGHSQMKRVRAERKWKMRHLKAGTYRELPRERAANWSKTRNPPPPPPTLQRYGARSNPGGGGELMKAGNVLMGMQMNALLLSLGPTACPHHHVFVFFLFLSIQLITSLHPSIHPSIYLWRCRAKSFLICQSSSKRLSGGRFGKKDDDSLRMLRFHCSVPGSYPLPCFYC